MTRSLYLALLLLSAVAQNTVARTGYRIELKVPDTKDSVVYLVHYYGKALPNIYKRDSARFDKNHVAVFNSTDSEFVGGIYIMLLSDRKTYFEFLLNRGDDIGITANVKQLPDGIKFRNSPENERFQKYTTYLSGYSDRQQMLKSEMDNAKTAADTAAVRNKSSAAAKELSAYRKDYAARYPGTLLAIIFNALEVPQVPEGNHFLPDGKTKDSTFAYRYYKEHYWDKFDLQDDRLIHTPVLDGRLEEYFSKLVLPWPDSMEKETDLLLRKARGTKHLFKYALWWQTRNVENSKVMGMDEVFVYLVENYYMKGDAFWLSSDELGKYIDRAMKIAPNVIGNQAPGIKLPDVVSKKTESLYDGTGKYTLVVFYSPSCGHCQTEIPAIDSLYKAVLKNKGVRIFSVATEGEENTITDFVQKNKLTDWTNTWDGEHVGDWRGKYDVYSTPTIYLLDDKKIIRGKRLDHSNIAGLIDMLEKKEKDQKTK